MEIFLLEIPLDQGNFSKGISSGLSDLNRSGELFQVEPFDYFNFVFLFQQDSGKAKTQQQTEILRKNLLANMPRIISSVAALWQAVTEALEGDSDLCIWGNPKVVKNQILGFLSPISVHHGPTFLAAIAVTWEERKSTDEAKKVLPVASRDQQILVDLVSAIRVMPIDTLVQTVHQVVKQPPMIQGASPNVALDVSTLELFYVYMQTSTSAQLGESWNSLLALLRDGLLVAPPALFLVLAILNEYVQKCPAFSDKKNQRDLQDITSKLVEACGTVAGACLEPKTWLGRNLAVKEDVDVPQEDSEGSISTAQQYSVQAQSVMAQILAPLLDVSYGSQEKDKVAALLTNLMYNITPYLKSHLPKNASSFSACSQLLANLSGFQYTRKAWKREVFELLLESSLFQMDMTCLSYWTTIIDNLMTHDITSFRDLMSKISMTQGGSYTLFSSREQEYEQRSQLLKRLAFVIFCSETDQYHKFMPNIQERLSEILRLPQVVPSVQAQVFLCFRILLLRMSSHHVISLWPTLISELVQVFTLIEQELCTDSEEFSSHIKLMSALDSSWVSNSSNGLHAHGHPHWLQLILAAAKLLDLAVLLPTHHLPQFQMYRWAFVSDCNTSSHNENDGLNGHDFVPHVMRICRLMDKKYGPVKPILEGKGGRLLLDGAHIDSLQQLHPFFASVGLREQSTTVDMESVENCLLQDFLEKMPTKGSH
ncbi:hypothetical protein RUM43_008634 [Polyplax serrata]|uniref:DOP1-like C-terminal domain-containing protein n=1 Tax=Polyplax serrata TaxID=468196 RepID=A0AAN8NYS3_POLSC